MQLNNLYNKITSDSFGVKSDFNFIDFFICKKYNYNKAKIQLVTITT